MSRSIGEPLADDTHKGALGTLHVIYAKPNAVAIAEIEFAQIAVQMALAAMLVNALHAALEDRVIALKGVGVRTYSPAPWLTLSWLANSRPIAL